MRSIEDEERLNRYRHKTKKPVVESAYCRISAALACLDLELPYRDINGNSQWPSGLLEFPNSKLG